MVYWGRRGGQEVENKGGIRRWERINGIIPAFKA
jgi:hypothetical protein